MSDNRKQRTPVENRRYNYELSLETSQKVRDIAAKLGTKPELVRDIVFERFAELEQTILPKLASMTLAALANNLGVAVRGAAKDEEGR